MENQAKLNEKYMPVLQCISSFEVTSYKKLLDIATSSFISRCFTSVFALADIILCNFSELDSKLSKRSFSPQISLFRWGTHLHMSLSVHSSVCHISGTVPHLTISFGTHM